jgi:uncharacterized protein (TIGR02145 family)
MKKIHNKGVAGYAPTAVAGFLFALVFTFNGCSGDDSDGGGSCDIKDYRTVVIGSQTWMAENLNCNVSGSKCYGDDNANCAKYGRLYDWATAMDIDKKYNSRQKWGGSDVKHRGICPSGWHIPSHSEWKQLIDYVGNDKGCTECAGKYLKATSGWSNDGNGTDTYSFSALPGGYGDSDGSFGSVGSIGHWWSASEDYSNSAYSRGMGYSRDDT